jgi:dynein intermediate chain
VRWVAISDIASKLTCDAPTELTEEERASIIAAPEFLEFVENSSKIVQRALNDGYDYIRDYTLNADSGG